MTIVNDKAGCYAVFFKTGVVKFGKAKNLALRLKHYSSHAIVSGGRPVIFTRACERHTALERLILQEANTRLTHIKGEMFRCQNEETAKEILMCPELPSEVEGGAIELEPRLKANFVLTYLYLVEHINEAFCKARLYDFEYKKPEGSEAPSKRMLELAWELATAFTPIPPRMLAFIVEQKIDPITAVAIVSEAARRLNHVALSAFADEMPDRLDDAVSVLLSIVRRPEDTSSILTQQFLTAREHVVREIAADIRSKKAA